jgi:hypothetical protein
LTDGGAGAWIGDACQLARDCDYAAALCLTAGFPDGLCSLPCTRYCPDRAGAAVTFCIENDEAQGRCVSRCSGDGGCRSGYVCEVRERFNEPTVLERVCVPPQPRPTRIGTPYPARVAAVQSVLDTRRLGQVLAADQVTVPSGAKILAVRITTVAGSPRYEYLGYAQTAFDDQFWPASSIKLMAALAAVETLEDFGFTVGGATITYSGTAPDNYSGPFRTLVNNALIISDNQSYDNLVLFVGFDDLNTQFLRPDVGFERTVIMRRYGMVGSLRHSPAITLREGSRTVNLPARDGTGTYDCPDSGNCTNPFELSEAIRRVGMHERLPNGERFRLTREDLSYLRYALGTTAGDLIVPAAAQVFGTGNVLFYRKGGYVPGSYRIDNAFLRDKATGEEYVVTIALPDAAGSAPFGSITRSILNGFRHGTLFANPLTP